MDGGVTYWKIRSKHVLIVDMTVIMTAVAKSSMQLVAESIAVTEKDDNRHIFVRTWDDLNNRCHVEYPSGQRMLCLIRDESID